MIRKIHIFCLFALLILFMGSVSANDDSNLTDAISINNDDLSLETKDIEMYYKDGSSFNVKVLNNENAVVGEKLNITINGVSYTRTTDSSGLAKLNINLIPGEYGVKTDCILNNQKLSKLNLIKVKEMNTSLIANKSIDMGYKEEFYDLTLIGGNNQPLVGKTLFINVNGVDYKRTTNELGQASLKINLIPGTYLISAKFEECFYVSSSVNSTIYVDIFNTKFLSNSIRFNKSSIKYFIKLVYGDNKPIKNHMVLFTINNMSSFVNTDSNGVASLNTYLETGSYVVNFKFLGSAGYRNSSGNNSIEVILSNNSYDDDLLRLETKNIDMFYKDGSSFIIKLLKGSSPVAGKKLNITINGISYYRTTDDGGLAKLNINLIPGYYDIKTECLVGNQTLFKINSINVNEMNTSFIADKTVELGYKQGKYTVTLIGGNGCLLSDKSVIFTINGLDYKRTTDQFGRASLNINLNPGNYMILARFFENFYNSCEFSSNVVVGVFSTRFMVNNTKFNTSNVIFSVKLLDSRNYAVKEGIVTFLLGKSFSVVKTDDNGMASFKMFLTPGCYNISFKSTSNIGFFSARGECQIEVCDDVIKITSQDFNTTVDNNLPYLISLTDDCGNDLINCTVKSDIYKNGFLIKTIESKTYEDGIARVNLDLNPGEYVIKNYVTSDNNSNTNKIIVSPASYLVSASNLILNRQGEYFIISVKNNETGCVLANKTVLITINGITYKRITNENGMAKLQINLGLGSFKIDYLIQGSSKYSDFKGTNNILIFDGVLVSNISSISSNINRKGEYFIVKLTDFNGIALKNKLVFININNIEYKRTTDENGIAKIKINLNDGSYLVTFDFKGDLLFTRAHGLVNLIVNRTPNFNYTLSIPGFINYKDYKCPFLANINVTYGENKYSLSYMTSNEEYYKLDERHSYFISSDGLEDFNIFKQGIEFKIFDENILLIFYGKTSDVGQFSVIYSSSDNTFKITFVIDNEVIAIVNIISYYSHNDYLKLSELGYPFLIDELCNSTFSQDNHQFNRQIQYKSASGGISLKNHPTFENFDVIQSYVITSEKITDAIMKREVDKAINFNGNYEKYAYELYLSALMTLWASDSLANEKINEFNVSWDKKQQLILANIDWAYLSLDAFSLIDVEGDENNIKLFKMYYGILFSLTEEFGLQSTGNNASSAANNIFKDIYNGNDFIIDEKDDLLVLKIVNSSDKLIINKTSGVLAAKISIDIKYIAENMVLKGSSSMKYCSIVPKVEDIFGYVLNSMKRSGSDVLGLFYSIKPRNVISILNNNFKDFATLAISYKMGYSLHPVFLIGIGIESQQFTLEYRNKYASNDTWQYFSSHGANWDVRTIAIVNKNTSFIDYVEIPYGDNGDLDMNNAKYIDSVNGKRDLDNYEKVKYKNYDNSIE